MPRIEVYQPERLTEELPDLVYYTVDAAELPPRLTIQSDGTRMASAYGHTGKGRYLNAYLGPRLAPVVMPVYYECLRRALPVYTITSNSKSTASQIFSLRSAFRFRGEVWSLSELS
jgi:hypothetical protein